MTTIWRRICGADPMEAFGAWLTACYVAGVLISVGFGLYRSLIVDTATVVALAAIPMAPLYGCVVGLVVAVCTAIPALMLTGVIRATRWPRPFADMIGGGGLGAALMVWMGGMQVFRGGDWKDWLIVAGFALAGAISGLVYWRVAGRPRPREPRSQKIAQNHVFD